MSSPANEIKAHAKLPSMPFPYLVTLLILLPFFLFRMHSGLVRHNLCGARRRVMACLEMHWEMGFSASEISLSILGQYFCSPLFFRCAIALRLRFRQCFQRFVEPAERTSGNEVVNLPSFCCCISLMLPVNEHFIIIIYFQSFFSVYEHNIQKMKTKLIHFMGQTRDQKQTKN
jgi:hypothetical protein